MTHLTSTQLSEPGAPEIEHLELCSTCRGRVDTDIDVERVRALVIGDLTHSSTRRARHLRPVWVVAGFAALVLAVFLPLLWVGSDDDAPVLTQPDQPIVLPPETDNEPPDPSAPPVGSESQSFEMVFEASDGVYGRLIWAGPDFYEALRASGEATYDYSFFAADSYGYDIDHMNPFPTNPDGDPIAGALPTEDPAVPWAILLDRIPPEEMWQRIGGGEMSESEPTHHLATEAWSDGDVRLEWNESGIPVLVQTPMLGEFRVTEFLHREIRAGEVGNNVDLPFLYALHLAADSPLEQRILLIDGIITFADYGTAAERAATCADVSVQFGSSSGMFLFGDGPDLERCREQFVDDIEKVWRVDSKWLGMDEHAILDAIIQGRDDLVELYSATPGPELPLASGEGWAISIRERGPGICFRMGVGGTTENITHLLTEGCTTYEFPLPGVLLPIFSHAENESGPFRADIFGLVTEEADRIVVFFESGVSIELNPGPTAQFGLRGFAAPLHDISEKGLPTTVEVYDGDELIGIYSHTEERPIYP